MRESASQKGLSAAPAGQTVSSTSGNIEPAETARTRKTQASPGLEFPRFFSTAGVDPFDQVEWELRDAIIGNEKGTVVFEQRDPSTAHWLCPRCAQRIEDHERLGMVAAGRWKATAPFRGVISFHIWEAYASTASLVAIVSAGYVVAETRDGLARGVDRPAPRRRN